MRLSNGDLEWQVEVELPPSRLDHYLKYRLPRYSRTSIQSFIDQGAVTRLEFDGRLLVLKSASRVRAGDTIRLRRPTAPPPDPSSRPQAELEVLYEDSALVVVNKPAGMLVHPAGVRIDGTVVGILRERFDDVRLDLAHRLDRETSGLLLMTRDPDANRRLKRAFKLRQVQKRYLAVTRGVPTWEVQTVDLPMGDSQGEIRVRQTIRDDGAPARTSFRRLEALGEHHALLEVTPHTGRLHQIRVHLEALGHALVGDKIYGGDGSAFLTFRSEGLTPALLEQLRHWRQALHAHEIDFEHPLTGRAMSFHAPLPADLKALISALREFRPAEAQPD